MSSNGGQVPWQFQTPAKPVSSIKVETKNGRLFIWCSLCGKIESMDLNTQGSAVKFQKEFEAAHKKIKSCKGKI